MDTNERDALYVAAAIYLDLESDEVDRILSDADIDLETATVTKCLRKLKTHKLTILPHMPLRLWT